MSNNSTKAALLLINKVKERLNQFRSSSIGAAQSSAPVLDIVTESHPQTVKQTSSDPKPLDKPNVENDGSIQGTMTPEQEASITTRYDPAFLQRFFRLRVQLMQLMFQQKVNSIDELDLSAENFPLQYLQHPEYIGNTSHITSYQEQQDHIRNNNKINNYLYEQLTNNNSNHSDIISHISLDDQRRFGPYFTKSQQQLKAVTTFAQEQVYPQNLLPSHLRKIFSFIAAVNAIAEAKNIIIVMGAGASVSAGIPDFRSKKTGIYELLKGVNLSNSQDAGDMRRFAEEFDPSDLFDLNYFRENPEPFYIFYFKMGIAGDMCQPTFTHQFIKALDDRGKLLRIYTQNIDNLEAKTNITDKNIITCHGNDSHFYCIDCKCCVPTQSLQDLLALQVIPSCQKVREFLYQNHYRPVLQQQLDQTANFAQNSVNPNTKAADISISFTLPRTLAELRARYTAINPQAAHVAAMNVAYDSEQDYQDEDDDQVAFPISHTILDQQRLASDGLATFRPDDSFPPLHSLLNTDCDGYWKPTIVFFGEELPDHYYQTLRNDLSRADLILCIGTSLQVQPVSSIPATMSDHEGLLGIGRFHQEMLRGAVSDLSQFGPEFNGKTYQSLTDDERYVLLSRWYSQRQHQLRFFPQITPQQLAQWSKNGGVTELSASSQSTDSAAALSTTDWYIDPSDGTILPKSFSALHFVTQDLRHVPIFAINRDSLRRHVDLLRAQYVYIVLHKAYISLKRRRQAKQQQQLACAKPKPRKSPTSSSSLSLPSGDSSKRPRVHTPGSSELVSLDNASSLIPPPTTIRDDAAAAAADDDDDDSPMTAELIAQTQQGYYFQPIESKFDDLLPRSSQQQQQQLFTTEVAISVPQSSLLQHDSGLVNETTSDSVAGAAGAAVAVGGDDADDDDGDETQENDEDVEDLFTAEELEELMMQGEGEFEDDDNDEDQFDCVNVADNNDELSESELIAALARIPFDQDDLSQGNFDEWVPDDARQLCETFKALDLQPTPHLDKTAATASALREQIIPVINRIRRTSLPRCDYEFLGNCDDVTRLFIKLLGW